MNTTHLQAAKRFAKAASLGLAVLAASAQAGTHIDMTVDATAQCVQVGGGTHNAFSSVNLPIGTWTVGIVSSTVNLCYPEGDCPQSQVNLTLYGSDYPYAQPMIVKPGAKQVIEVTTPNDSAWGYITDAFCADNAGSTVVRFTKK